MTAARERENGARAGRDPVRPLVLIDVDGVLNVICGKCGRRCWARPAGRAAR